MDPEPAAGEPESVLCLVLAEPEKIQDINLLIMKKILASNCTPLIVTVNKPNKILAKMYAKDGIGTDTFYVVDAVTQYSGGECTPAPRVKYVNNPSNLTDLGIAITEILKLMPPGKKCILFDSVSMLLIHIPSVTASKFLHFVVNKLKLSDVSGIFLSVEKGLDPVVMAQMSASVDSILDFEQVSSTGCRL